LLTAVGGLSILLGGLCIRTNMGKWKGGRGSLCAWRAARLDYQTNGV